MDDITITTNNNELAAAAQNAIDDLRRGKDDTLHHLYSVLEYVEDQDDSRTKRKPSGR